MAAGKTGVKPKISDDLTSGHGWLGINPRYNSGLPRKAVFFLSIGYVPTPVKPNAQPCHNLLLINPGFVLQPLRAAKFTGVCSKIARSRLRNWVCCMHRCAWCP